MIDIFVPVYNEKDNIKPLLDALQEKVQVDFEVMIVYDMDEDNTLPVLKEIEKNYDFNIRLIKNLYGRGALNALKTGIEMVEHEYWVFTMADLSDSLETINIMSQKLKEGYDMVVGSRYMRGGKKTGGPVLKSLFSKVSGRAMNILIGIPTVDMTNGFKMYRKDVLKKIQLESKYGFEIGLELALKTYLEGYKITEVPASWQDREAGTSNFNMWKLIPHYLYWCFYAMKEHFFHGKPKKNKR
ncbi:MAG: glycosyltransferase [Lachnospiraceae bacterium]|nr:glycosyltransferase [Lachnospiraceae bacterium]